MRRLGELLRRAKGRIDYRRLDRISPLAVPVLLEIGKERVLDGTAEDELLDIAAQELIDEATRLRRSAPEDAGTTLHLILRRCAQRRAFTCAIDISKDGPQHRRLAHPSRRAPWLQVPVSEGC